MIAWRDATPADADALAALFARCFIATFGHLYDAADLDAFLAEHPVAAWAAQLADPAYAIRLAVADGQAVAFVKLGPPALPVEHRGPAIELRQFYVDADHHGSGLARQGMDWAIATARARGAADMFLSVFTDNHRALRFYERYGFERVGLYTFMVGTHADDDFLMRLRLEPPR